LDLDSIGDLVYLQRVINESLRLNPPSVTTTPYYFERETKIGSLTVEANCSILVNIFGLHRNGKYWQRPEEFLPERFDPSHPLAKTPSGESRMPLAFMPWNAGKRICAGKSFAELVLKVVLTALTQNFDLSFVDSEKYRRDNLPIS